MTLIAKQVAAGVPIYDLLFKGVDHGCMTRFPGEGPMATVRLFVGGPQATVSADTLHACLIAAHAALIELDHDAAMQEEHIEDEDGEIARMRAAENRAELWSMLHDDPEPY